MTPTTALRVRPSATNGTAPRKPPICGIGLQIATHTASSGASGTPSESDATRVTTPASAAMNSVPAM